MMLHRHFENDTKERRRNMTTTNGAEPKVDNKDVSAIFPPDEPKEEPKRRGKSRKAE